MEKKEKRKLRVDKGKLAVRIMSGFLAVLMIGSVVLSLVYYLIDFFANK